MNYREFLTLLSQQESRGFDRSLLNAMCDGDLDAEIDEDFADGLLQEIARYCREHTEAVEWRQRMLETSGVVREVS